MNLTPKTIQLEQATIIQWLESLPHISNVRACRVTIGSETWEAARYTTTLTYTRDMDAVRWGKKKEGETYTRESIYCLGKLPKCHSKGVNKQGCAKKEQGVCFPYEGVEWYVVAYVCKEIADAFKEFHPFGASFILGPWDLPNSKIDDGEPKPYTRVEMQVAY